MFFTFPEDAHWNAEQQAVEFGVEIGEYRGVVRVPRRVFQRLLPERPTPERCVEAYYLQRTRFESITERKLRLRNLTDDGNVEISGRDFPVSPGGHIRRKRRKTRRSLSSAAAIGRRSRSSMANTTPASSPMPAPLAGRSSLAQ